MITDGKYAFINSTGLKYTVTEDYSSLSGSAVINVAIRKYLVVFNISLKRNFVLSTNKSQQFCG